MIKVTYHSHPDKPISCNQIGRFRSLTDQTIKEFEDINAAIEFWFECSYPITTLDELMSGTYSTELLKCIQGLYNQDTSLLMEVEENEEVLNQKILYNLSTEDEIL